MIYSIYDLSTGQILSTINDSAATLMPDNAVAGSYNDQEHYVDTATNNIVNKPVQPSANHVWDWTTKTWQLDNTQTANSARQQRNTLLSAVDRVNPVWYSSLTSEQQTELITYRSALLAVPQQSGFPVTIEWPNKPSWLG
jgi:hypothetical protein